jgi:hypothetical protein
VVAGSAVGDLDAGGRRLGPGGEQERATGLGFSLLKFFELEGRFPDVLENWNSANTVLH